MLNENLVHWNLNKKEFENYRLKKRNKIKMKELNLMNELRFKKKIENLNFVNYYKDVDIILIRTNKDF